MSEFSILGDLARPQGPFTSFLDEADFDITQVLSIRFTEAGIDAGASPDAQSEWGHLSVQVIPEPATMGVLALGGLAVLRRRREQ